MLLQTLLENAVKHGVSQERGPGRIDVIVRRTTFRRDKALARAHVLEGLLVALDNIDRVIAVIRGSSDVPAARATLLPRIVEIVKAGEVPEVVTPV